MSKKLAAQCQCLKKAVKDLSTESLDGAEGIIDIKRIFLSEYSLVKKYPISSKEWKSESDIQYTVDYDDLCKPFPSPDHPAFQNYDDVNLEPILCTWDFIKIQDLQIMKRHLFNENAIKSLIEKKLPENNILFKGKGKEIFLNFVWEIFKFMRDENYSGKGISSILGLFYLTHRFFLSNAWHTANETYDFFKTGVSLHAFLKPPERDMLFDFYECDKLLDMFRLLYIQNLEIVRLVCIPKYNLILKLKKCGLQNYEKLLTTEISEIQM